MDFIILTGQATTNRIKQRPHLEDPRHAIIIRFPTYPAEQVNRVSRLTAGRAIAERPIKIIGDIRHLKSSQRPLKREHFESARTEAQYLGAQAKH